MTKEELEEEGNRLHEDFAVLMARLVLHVGTKQACAILICAATLFREEAERSGHTEPRQATG